MGAGWGSRLSRGPRGGLLGRCCWCSRGLCHWHRLLLLRCGENVQTMVVANLDVANPLCPERPIVDIENSTVVWNRNVGRASGVGVNGLYRWTRPKHFVSWRKSAVTATLTKHIRVTTEFDSWSRSDGYWWK